jgi:ABC-type branched-subunit amino acid transport system ATPase component
MMANRLSLVASPQWPLFDERQKGWSFTKGGQSNAAKFERIMSQPRFEEFFILVIEQKLASAPEMAHDAVVENNGPTVYEGTPAQLKREDAILKQCLGD